MENPRTKWWFLAGKIIYKWDIYTMAMLNNQRVGLFSSLRVWKHHNQITIHSPEILGYEIETLLLHILLASTNHHSRDVTIPEVMIKFTT